MKENIVFISYAHADYYDNNNRPIKGSAIDIIRKSFELNNIKYWIDDIINPGDPFAKNIGEAIDQCDIFLFVSSARSNSSEWAQGEIHTARSKNKRIIPFRVDLSPYHNSYCVYLSHLDFIDYTQNRDSAIKKLISTIQNERLNIKLPERVTFELKGRDLSIGDTKLSNKVFQIFSAIELQNSIRHYIDIVSAIKNFGIELSPSVNGIVEQFNEIADFSNFNLQQQKIINLSDEINKLLPSEERINLFLLQLGLMLIYYQLGEINVLRNIQKKIAQINFDISWWERYGDNIKYAGIIALGLFFAPNAAQGAVIGHKSGKDAAKEHREKVREAQNYFEAFRDVISSLTFN